MPFPELITRTSRRVYNQRGGIKRGERTDAGPNTTTYTEPQTNRYSNQKTVGKVELI